MINQLRSIINSIQGVEGSAIRITLRPPQNTLERRRLAPPADHGRRSKLALQACEAFLLGFELSGLRCHARNDALQAFFRGVARFVLSNPEAALLQYKKVFTHLRSSVISESPVSPDLVGMVLPRCWRNLPPLTIMRITMIGRALPRPTEPIINKALAKHHALATAPFGSVTHPDVVRSLEAIVKPLKNPPPVTSKGGVLPEMAAQYPLYGTSATSLNSRKQHGRAGIIHAAEKALKPSRPVGPVLALRRQAAIKKTSAPLRFSLRNFASRAIIAESSRNTMEAIRKSFPYSAESFTTAVPELGFKARVVTKSHPLLVTDGHLLRRRFFPTLRSHPAWDRSLRDKPKWLPFLSPGKGPSRLFYSLDLSAATDGLSHHTVGEFCRIAKIDPDVIYRNMVVDGSPLERGIFMGLPMSWTILSMVHKAVCDSVYGLHSFFLKGDDLIAYWTEDQYKRYCFLLESTGLTVNVSKTFVGPRSAVYCEGYYTATRRFKRRGRWYIGLVLQPTISVRTFFPEKESLAFGISEALAEVSASIAPWFNRVVRIRFPRLMSLSKLFGLNPFLPGNLGGSGLLFADPARSVESARDRCRINSIFGGVPAFSKEGCRRYDGTDGSEFSAMYRKIRMVPRGAGLTCPHFDKWMAFATNAVAYRGAKIGSFPKDVTNHDAFRVARRISRDGRSGVDFPVTYADIKSVSSRLVPLVSSVPYYCKCRDSVGGRSGPVSGRASRFPLSL